MLLPQYRTLASGLTIRDTVHLISPHVCESFTPAFVEYHALLRRIAPKALPSFLLLGSQYTTSTLSSHRTGRLIVYSTEQDPFTGQLVRDDAKLPITFHVLINTYRNGRP